MTITREQETWAMALWGDREHGEDAEEVIARKVLHFEQLGDDGRQKLWIQVARRYAQLKDVVNAERSWLGPIDDTKMNAILPGQHEAL
jgi:hypothetical protein